MDRRNLIKTLGLGLAASHSAKDPGAFYRAAMRVDRYIAELMMLLPSDTHVLYYSGHGFNFKRLGEVEDSHGFAPRGMVATSFETKLCRNVTRPTVKRWVYSVSGGNPDHCSASEFPYAMYGVDIR
jgi:hypothetical protein